MLKRYGIAAAAVGLSAAAGAQAAVITVPENIQLQPNTANQLVEIFVTGEANDPQITGMNLYASIGDGTGPGAEPVFRRTVGANTNAQGVNYDTTIFRAPQPGYDPEGTGQDQPFPSTVTFQTTAGQPIAESSIAFNESGQAIVANGKIVRLFIDTTGINGGVFPLKLMDVDNGAGSDTAFILSGGTELVPTIDNGSIQVVPEPAAFGLIGLAGLALVRRRAVK